MIDIVQAREEHLTGIVERWMELMDYHAERDPIFTRSPDGHIGYAEYVGKIMTSPTGYVLAALDGDTVVGFSLSMTANYPPPLARRDYGYISDIAIAQTYRGRGIGEDMVRKTLTWFAERGITRVELRVSSCNDTALAFWKGRKFREYMKIMYLEPDEH